MQVGEKFPPIKSRSLRLKFSLGSLLDIWIDTEFQLFIIRRLTFSHFMIKVYQSFHDNFLKNPQSNWIVPIGVGGYTENGILSDNHKDSISNLNPYFCELTAIYWVWKNTSNHDVGFIHYRRYFNFLTGSIPNDCCLSFKDRYFNRKIYKTPANHWLKFNAPSVQYLSSVEQHDVALNLLENHDIVVPNLQPLKPNITSQYISCVESKPWKEFISQISKNPINNLNPNNFFINENAAPICNMFLMKREIFNQYCSDLFSVINAVYTKVGSPFDRYNNRYPGFLSERYLWYWICAKKIDFTQKPMVFLV